MRLKELRKSRKYKQTEIAEMLSCSQGVYSRYENEEREPPFDIIKKLADIYGVTVDYLMGRETPDEKIVTREGPIEVVRFDGTKKDGKSNMLAAIFAELETMSEEDLKVALQHARFLKSQK